MNQPNTPTDELIFATGNPNKVREAKVLLQDYMQVKSKKDIGCLEELPETNPTLEANAIQKARYLADNYGVHCFSEDTGLEIDALAGEPGVYSARYAGLERDANKNMDLVLSKMQGIEDRGAQFRTIIALILHGKTYTFEGIVRGQIAQGKSGSEGFGYDPIFIPEGAQKTFAAMSTASKNQVSHRARALAKLVDFLQSYYQNQAS
ncbi:MAG: RdgB/HAM1 family non-canonical purine NTP pyrophosphatase [Bacteroidota bacterium]